MVKSACFANKTAPLLCHLNVSKIAFILSFFVLITSSSCQAREIAKKGVIDLRNRHWLTDGITDLNGEWAFYWHHLYTPSSIDAATSDSVIYATVPGFWNGLIPGIGLIRPAFGYATYRLKVLCPSSNEKLELKFLTIASAYKLFVNGKEILEVGKVGTSASSYMPAYRPQIVPVTPVNNELDVVIQVANFNYSTGGLWDFIKLGTHQQIQNYWLRKILSDYFIAGSFLLMGIFYFVIFFFFRRSKAPLYFAIFCTLVAVRPLVTDELAINYFAHWNDQLIKHIEFTFFYLTVPVLSLFSYELFREEFSKKILTCILIISAPFVFVTIFTSPFIFRYTLRPFQAVAFITACYGLYVYINAVKNKRIGSAYFLAGFIVLFTCLVNDMLYTGLVIESINLVYFGLFVFIICQATALSRQFFHTFNKLETLNKKLENINDELNRKNNTIIETNEQLTKLNAELDILVFRTSHDLRSPITSIVALVHIIKEEKEEIKRNLYLEMQRKSLHRLNALITDILDFAANKRAGLTFEPVDLREFVQSVLQDHLFSENSLKVERIVEIDQQGTFTTDKMRLGMVISNLVSNALKYHSKERENAFLKIIIYASNEFAEIQLIDNGEGIEEIHLPNIFTMYYRVSKAPGGSGLGLYIVKEAIEKLGGTIKVESEAGVGTKFLLFIPNHIE